MSSVSDKAWACRARWASRARSATLAWAIAYDMWLFIRPLQSVCGDAGSLGPTGMLDRITSPGYPPKSGTGPHLRARRTHDPTACHSARLVRREQQPRWVETKSAAPDVQSGHGTAVTPTGVKQPRLTRRITTCHRPPLVFGRASRRLAPRVLLCARKIASCARDRFRHPAGRPSGGRVGDGGEGSNEWRVPSPPASGLACDGRTVPAV